MKKLRKFTTLFLLLFYLLLLVKIILFKSGTIDFLFILKQFASFPYTIEAIQIRISNRGNIIPFETIMNTFNLLSSWSIFNLLGNILIFIPLGILLTNIKGNIVFVFMLSLITTCTLEISQFITNIGTFDVDDILLNSFGGFIGYLLYTQVKIRFTLKKMLI